MQFLAISAINYDIQKRALWDPKLPRWLLPMARAIAHILTDLLETFPGKPFPGNVIWFYGFMVLWIYGFMVSKFYDYMVGAYVRSKAREQK